MTDATQKHPLALKRLVYRLDGMETVVVTRDVEYARGVAGPLTMDVYHPGGDGTAPVVVIANGYRDVGGPRPLGCAFKAMGTVTSLAQLLAASGIAAGAYTSREPAADAGGALDYLAANASTLRIETTRIGLWAFSGHVPLALGILMDRHRTIGAAVLSNGFMLDLEGTAVADAAETYRFANASSGRTIGDLPADLPLLIVRSGRDEFTGVNETIDRFVADALRRNLPITLVNHAGAPHAFEINEDSDASRHVIGQMLEFMRFHLDRR